MENVKQITESLIQKLGVEGANIEVALDGAICKISIESADEHSLIGRDLEKFEAFSHLLKRILARELGEEAKIIIDINGMRAKQEAELKVKATIIAERARAFKSNVEMDPMSSYERMIVHSHLEGAPNIKTESIGEGKSRRLVVKYIE